MPGALFASQVCACVCACVSLTHSLTHSLPFIMLSHCVLDTAWSFDSRRLKPTDSGAANASQACVGVVGARAQAEYEAIAHH